MQAASRAGTTAAAVERPIAAASSAGRHALLLLAAALISLAAPGVADAQLAPRMWIGPDGENLPFADDAEILAFLRDAEIVEVTDLPTGITRPRRLLLRLGAVEAYAVFRYLEERPRRADDAAAHGEIFFRDSAGFECAAYELARLVNVDQVPPVIRRTVGRDEGTVQLWIEGTMTERERLDRGASDPVEQRWQRQLGVMNVFDALIGNLDRNRGNMLIDPYWRVWFIDHTRAFRGSTRMDTATLNVVERGLWDGLRALDPAAVRERLAPFLTDRELNALLGRAEKLVEHFEQLIRRHGEARVVYSY